MQTTLILLLTGGFLASLFILEGREPWRAWRCYIAFENSYCFF